MDPEREQMSDAEAVARFEAGDPHDFGTVTRDPDEWIKNLELLSGKKLRMDAEEKK